jgi:C4-dicarboxylate transporter, DctM subunit
MLRPQDGPRGEKFTWGEKLKSLSGMIETLLVFVPASAACSSGCSPPPRRPVSGSWGCCWWRSFVGRSPGRSFVEALYDTLKSSCMIMMLVAGATVFGKFLAVTSIPYDIAQLIGGYGLPPLVVLTMVILVYFIGGCFMDSLALVMLTVPVFFPLITGLGFDPIWFGVMIVMVTEMGVITPPVGFNVYVVYGVSRGLPGGAIPLERFSRALAPLCCRCWWGLFC